MRPAGKPESRSAPLDLTAGGTCCRKLGGARQAPFADAYHREGPDLLAKHFCPQGIAGVPGRSDAGGCIAFTTSHLDPAGSRPAPPVFDLTNPDRPVRGEIYASKDGPGAQERLPLVRDSGG